jgi:hypothetical protein
MVSLSKVVAEVRSKTVAGRVVPLRRTPYLRAREESGLSGLKKERGCAAMESMKLEA